MAVNNSRAVGWFDDHKGALTYSMSGSRNGWDGTADCSGSVVQALYEAGAPKPAYLYNTVTMPGWLSSIGYTRISVNQSWDAQEGDVVLMSWGPDMSTSGGAGGHTGLMKDDTRFISTDWSTGGQIGTAVSEWNWDTYYNNSAPTYIEVWRQLDGGSYDDGGQEEIEPTGSVSAIKRFKSAANEFGISQPFVADDVHLINGAWYVVNSDMYGGGDADWALNGVPLAILHRVDGGDDNNVEQGAKLAFNAGYDNGTIDEYDEDSNAVRVNFGDYGDVWFDADWLLNA